MTDVRLDLGLWEQIFYDEFDGQRRKRVMVKVMGGLFELVQQETVLSSICDCGH